MRASSFWMSLAMILAALAGTAEPARASHSRLDVDIEDLDAEIRWDGEKWSFHVEYEVEIKHAAPDQAFDLVLNLISKSNNGQPVQIVVPLVTPSKMKDDKVEYKSTLAARIDSALIGEPDRLKVHAVVVPRGGGEVLDKESTSVKHRH
jgi:hypothetical protein